MLHKCFFLIKKNYELKLCFRYNFHKAHCAEALEVAGENLEKSLEILFHKYFKIDFQDKPPDVPPDSELLDMRRDEKDVLESIYETSFRAKESNIWSIEVNLEYITKMYLKQNPDVAKKKENINYNNVKKKKELCKMYLKGPCRFGANCKFSHETKNEPVAQTTDSPVESVKYELEIRFSEETVYPYQPPLIFVKVLSSTKIIPELTLLKITLRLLDEAKNLAQDGIPSVYSIAELLKNEEDILNFIQFDTRTFPDPSETLYPQLTGDQSIDQKKYPSHYKKEQKNNTRSKVDFDEIININKDILKIWLEKQDNSRYHRMMSSRKELPAWKKKDEILSALSKSQVSN